MNPVQVNCELRHQKIGRRLLDLCGYQKVQFVDYIRESDFEILPRVAGIFVDGCEQNVTAARKKTVRFRNFTRSGLDVVGVMILMRSKGDHDRFMQFQKLCSIDMNLKLVTVTDVDEAAMFILKMAASDQRMRYVNPVPSYADEDVLKVLLRIPGMGPVKARALLQSFKSMRGIFEASEEDIALVVGHSTAQKLTNFLS